MVQQREAAVSGCQGSNHLCKSNKLYLRCPQRHSSTPFRGPGSLHSSSVMGPSSGGSCKPDLEHRKLATFPRIILDQQSATIRLEHAICDGTICGGGPRPASVIMGIRPRLAYKPCLQVGGMPRAWCRWILRTSLRLVSSFEKRPPCKTRTCNIISKTPHTRTETSRFMTRSIRT